VTSDIIKKTKQEVEGSDNDSKDRAAAKRTAAKREAFTEQDRSNLESSQPAIAR